MGDDSSNQGRFRRRLVLAVLVVVHLAGAYAGIRLVGRGSLAGWFTPLSVSGETFFSYLFVSGIFLYAVAAALRCFRVPLPGGASLVGAVLAVSLAISILQAADAGRTTPTTIPAGLSLWGLMYVLLTQHPAVLVLSLLAFVATIAGVYYIFRSLLTVEYSGAGVQIKLPGQTVYYVPIYPQVSWQPTGIVLKQGESVSIEISGYVSPGALQELSELEDHMAAFVRYQETGRWPDDRAGRVQAPTWPYTPPIGYLEEWYGPGKKLDVLAKHPIYKKDYFYRDDPLLTVKGLPHNKVIGILRSEGEPEPRSASLDRAAYDWENEGDREQLLLLSSVRYPIQVEARRSGELWIVINDVDIARWDNGGMFFLRLTQNAWRKGGR
ncbi:MAG TPA: hypothetical protein VFT45_26080 [Longimicrobium sp.]|nr:hypothetical protein [Longimicrobium sp.]